MNFQDFLEEEKATYESYGLFRPFCESIVDIFLDPDGIRFLLEDVKID